MRYKGACIHDREWKGEEIKKERDGCVDSTYPMSDRSKTGTGAGHQHVCKKRQTWGTKGQREKEVGKDACTVHSILFEVFKVCWLLERE
jgi:hypothetical protein